MLGTHGAGNGPSYRVHLNQLPSPFFVFIGPHVWHMDVPSLGVKLELQLWAYTTATATLDPEPTERGQESNLHPMVTRWVHYC